jgi:glycosyltransferase involved in cell wall biosynthesis
MLKVAIQQPAIPKYRIPVFEKLCSKFEITVFYGHEATLKNTESKLFPSHPSRFKRFVVWKVGELLWDHTQFGLGGDRSFDAVILSWNTRYLSLIPALLRARINGIPVILWGHGYSKKKGGLMRDSVRNWVTKLADAVLFYDPVSKDAASGNKSCEHFFAAPNAIDQRPIVEQNKAWNSSSDRLEKFVVENDLQDRELVLFVSRVEPKNRVDVLVRAIEKVRMQHPNILLIVIGKGLPETMEPLVELTEQLELQDNVRFLGPIYGEESLAPWFLSSKVFCYPSNVGLSLFHAFGYGLPALLGNDFSKCNPEIYAFRAGYNGLTFEDANPISLSEKISSLIMDPAFQKTLGENASKTAAEVVTLDNMVAGFVEAINFAVSGRSKSKRSVSENT